jgi:hypothetical protein
MARVSFDPAFAGPAEWALMYRAYGLQVVPAHLPQPKPAQWKRPAIKEWRQFQKELVPQSLFDRWYASNGLFARHQNMGMLTGPCSNNVFVVDLDTYKPGAGAEQWWQKQLQLNSTEAALHYWQVRTGGGGRHLFFRAPEGWVVPNNNTAIGVDIKGWGGFVMLPPSLHTDGVYTWEPGRSPEDVGELEEAPQWWLHAVDDLAGVHGGHKPETRGEDGERIATATPDATIDAWGNQIDRREPKMRDIVWHGALELERAGGRPGTPQELEFKQAALARYYATARTRLTELDNLTGLEREGRGETLFEAKWARAMRKFGTPELAQAAARPNPKAAPVEPFKVRLERFKAEHWPSVDTGIELLNVPGVKNMAEPKWLIEGVIPEEALGFIFGPPGSYKSFIALSQALSLATRRESWWGHAVHRPGAVVYVSSEGHTDLKFRIMAWEAQNGCLADDAPFYLIRVPLNLMRVEDVAKLLDALRRTETEAGVSVTAVYIDTVSRVMPGADENLQKDMTMFIAACDHIRATFHATVIGVHHTSRAGGSMRGSTVFDGASDFLLQVEREEGAERGSLVADKIKAAKDGWKEPFWMIKHELAMGHSSLAATRAPDLIRPEPGKWPEKDACRTILRAIGRAWDAGRPWSLKVQTRKEGRYAPRQIAVDFGLPADLAEHMVTTWLENGVLAYEMVDKHSKKQGLKVIGGID